MTKQVQSAWSLALVALTVASCDLPRLPALVDGGGTSNGAGSGGGGTSDGGEPDPLLNLEFLAGDIGSIGYTDGIGAAARFSAAHGVAVDSVGNVYVADTNNHTIRKITPAGVVTTLAGAVGMNGGADGTGAAARFHTPWGIAVDSAGTLYVADTYNATIRKVTADGVVTTLAGLTGLEGSADGTGAAGRFYGPSGVAVDGAGNVYVADTNNSTIRKVTADGVVTTLAGAAGMAGAADGIGAAARFNYPTSVVVDGDGNVYVADQRNYTVRKITASGLVTTLAGAAGMFGSEDGTGATARFVWPSGVATDSEGNLYVTEPQTIRKVSADGVVTTLAGVPSMEGAADGVGAAARFAWPHGVAVDSNTGNVYVADRGNSTIRKITASGVVTTFAGAASISGSADGVGTTARFRFPSGVAVDSAGDIYVADSGNSTIRRVTTTGDVTTLAARVIDSVDGTGAAAHFVAPTGVAVDRAGNVFVVDVADYTLRKVNPGAVVTTLAGAPGQRGIADGANAAARFHWPSGVSIDDAGTLYVADDTIIRKVTVAGVVTTIAGDPDNYGHTDGIGAAARFYFALGVAVDSTGTLYIADTENHTIRKITPEGIVTTLAGAPGISGCVDGTGASARFFRPVDLAVNSAGTIYVADTGNSAIRKVTPAGVVTTVAGTPGRSQIILGPTPAFAVPTALAITGDSIVVSDTNAILLLRHGAR